MPTNNDSDLSTLFIKYWNNWQLSNNLQNIEITINKIDNFRKKFTKDKLEVITLEEYCLGGDSSQNTYSYFLEYDSDDLGSIRGGAANKHGVYKSRNTGKYVYSLNRFNSTEDAIHKIGIALAKISSGATPDNDEVSRILPHTIKYKSYFIYNPKKESLPIYSTADARTFCEWFEIKIDGGEILFELHKKLLKKLNDISPIGKLEKLEERDLIKIKLIFMYFLYCNYPLRPEEKSLIIEPSQKRQDISAELSEEDDDIRQKNLNEMQKNLNEIQQKLTYIKEIANNAKKDSNDTKKELEKKVRELQSGILEMMGIFAAVLTLVVADIQILKGITEPKILLGLMIGINSLPFIFYVVVKSLFLPREEDGWLKRIIVAGVIIFLLIVVSFVIIYF